MNKKYYNCFSIGLMKFLEDKNVFPVKELIHDKSKNTIYVYRMDKKLSGLLTEWTNRKGFRDLMAV